MRRYKIFHATDTQPYMEITVHRIELKRPWPADNNRLRYSVYDAHDNTIMQLTLEHADRIEEAPTVPVDAPREPGSDA